MRFRWFWALALVALAASAAVAGGAGWPSQLRLVSGPSGGTWFALGGAFANIWSEAVLPVTSGTGGGVSNVVTISKGQSDVGLTTLSVLGAGVKGVDPFKEPAKGTVLFANLYRQYAYFLMRKDYADKMGVKSVGDIVRKKLPIRFATLTPGTASEFVIRTIFEKGYGVGWKDIQSWGGKVQFASYSDGADLLADNHIDCFAFQVSKVASVIMDIENRTEIVILPVDEEAIKAVGEYLGTTRFEIEPGVYKSVSQPIPTVGDYTCLAIAESLPEDLVSKLAEVLWNKKDEIAKSFKDMADLNPKEAVVDSVPVHPGAKKFWSSLAKR